MASDLTPERRAFLRDTANLESGIVLVAKEELLALLDAAERCADYDRVLVAARALMQCPKCIGPCDDPTVHAEIAEALRALDDKEQRT